MDKKQCNSCGKPKCSCKNKDFTKRVIEIDNPEQITLMRKVSIPASMGDDTAVPPTVGKYKNVLLYYEANHKSYLYSSDGIPTQLANGLTDYEDAVNLPEINGHTLIGDKTGSDLGLQEKLTAGNGIEIAQDNTISVEGIDEYAHFFDTVDDMKAATNLKSGDYAKTLGYYSKDDKGGAFYKIASVAPVGYYESLTSGLYAEIVVEDVMNVRQFGAKGDGTTDDTTAIQTALNNSVNVNVPAGTYMVDAVTELKPNSNNRIVLDNDAKLKAITNSETHYRIFHLVDVVNVEICGGTLEGDRLTHTGVTGEWGNCIRCYGDCDNIYIHDINLINPWGDGLGVVITGAIRTERVHVKNARRNGYSIGAANGFSSTDDIIEDTNGTAPQSGVDIEPDNGNQLLKNITFTNLISRNNVSNGLAIACNQQNTYPTYIKLIDCSFVGNNHGIWVESQTTATGVADIINPHITDCNSRGIYIQNRGLAFRVNVHSPYINNYGITQTNVNGIYITGLSDGSSGNVYIFEPTVINNNPASNNNVAISIYGSTTTFTNVSIIDPINLSGDVVSFNSPSSNVVISDKYNTMKNDVDENSVIGGSNFVLYCTTSSYTTLRRIRISDTSRFPVGTRIRFLNNGAYGVQIYFENQYIYGITTAVNKTVTSTDDGAYLEIMKIDTSKWTIVAMSGTFTTN